MFLSVCLSVMWVCYDKTTDHAVFTAKQLRVSNVSTVSLKTKFERVPSIGAQPMLGWLTTLPNCYCTIHTYQWWANPNLVWFKSWLNHWWWFDLSTKDLIWKHVIWFGFDFILCDLIWWFEQITTFSNLGQGIMITLLVFLLQLN